MVIRRALHRRGFRYQLHRRDLPGHPDLVFPKYKAVIHVHGCFWHGHRCHLFKWPSTRPEFWRAKIEDNKRRDENSHALLHDRGWRTLVIWECALKGKERLQLDVLTNRIAAWLISEQAEAEIGGRACQ